jgi:hypothetical protein
VRFPDLLSGRPSRLERFLVHICVSGCVDEDRLCGLVRDPEVWVQIPALPELVGLERGPLSLVITTEELLGRKVAAPV